MGFTRIYDWILYYVKLDTCLLQKINEHLFRGFIDVIGINPINAKKFTVSGLSFVASQIALMKDKRVGNFFVNNTRTYSVSIFIFPPRASFASITFCPHCLSPFQILKNSLRGGLTAVCRTAAGEKTDMSEYVRLFAECSEFASQPAQGDDDDDDDDDEPKSGHKSKKRRIEASFRLGLPTEEDRRELLSTWERIDTHYGSCPESYFRACNSHSLPDELQPGLEAKRVVYTDINSLYARAGKLEHFLLFFLLLSIIISGKTALLC
jgi:hypothetical protein